MELTIQEESTLSVFDLPQLYTRPPAADLLSTLDRLRVEPVAWDHGDYQSTNSKIDEEGVPKYLTSIVASSLSWIKDDSVKEQIWEAASTRLSERSGRSGIPSVSRTFVIPSTQWTNSVSVSLHEPSLTADNLGHKTWLASFLLSKRIPSLLRYIPPLEQRGPSRARVIELGAGTGLLGLAIAGLFDVQVHLTDLPAIVPNLRINIAANARGNASVGELDWSNLPTCPSEEHQKFDMVVAADPLYSPEHPAWLVAAVRHVLRNNVTARLVIGLPLREAYVPEVEDFKKRLRSLGMKIETEGLETGVEDWGSACGRNERTEVKCWWAVWRWA
ncbi:MAG: hypothetical protein Q9219_005505 [cf. Caloplaca sp. 3 TL-2023]